MNRQRFSTLLLIIAVTSASSFSSRPRKSTRRGRREASSSPLTTRRVFCFTFAGGAHNMFSTMRRPVHAKEPGTSSSPEGAATSSTSLNYRTSDEFEESFQMDALWQTALYELREDVDKTAELEQRQLLTASSSLKAQVSELKIVEEENQNMPDSELVEAAEAFIPVVIEIGIVAAVASAQQS
mmetsp:Transcript_29160/g.45065  ORF Transcript_29160/g.45065 Transcript_29160/m.45065 type:complete len:183 (-) Transcript_29160:119-667(-)